MEKKKKYFEKKINVKKNSICGHGWRFISLWACRTSSSCS